MERSFNDIKLGRDGDDSGSLNVGVTSSVGSLKVMVEYKWSDENNGEE